MGNLRNKPKVLPWIAWYFNMAHRSMIWWFIFSPVGHPPVKKQPPKGPSLDSAPKVHHQVWGWGGIGHVNVSCNLHALWMLRSPGVGVGWGMLTFHVKIALVYTLFVFHCSSLTWNSITCFMLKSRVSSAEWIVEDGRSATCAKPGKGVREEKKARYFNMEHGWHTHCLFFLGHVNVKSGFLDCSCLIDLVWKGLPRCQVKLSSIGCWQLSASSSIYDFPRSLRWTGAMLISWFFVLRCYVRFHRRIL